MGFRFVGRGMLHSDGVFEIIQKNGKLRVKPGSFEVGVLESALRS